MSEPYQIAKIDEARSMVFGFASIAIKRDGQPMIDRHGDLIPADVLEAAAYSFVLHSRAAGVDHAGDAVGELIESVLISDEKASLWGLVGHDGNAIGTRWWLGFRISPDTMRRVVDGELKMFSIQGQALVDELEME